MFCCSAEEDGPALSFDRSRIAGSRAVASVLQTCPYGLDIAVGVCCDLAVSDSLSMLM
ncbi:hypothetical protein Acr_01g0004830 [Actinidia rufa]|uniref:Uncharacterized protein n=1 Tax=Actinidia rufa TaxID=165716 RepID=A0A7J0E2G1_9ERIC|nr:hypothetical protein Acr_01g0004830 [Actinidia rufa]